MTIDYQESVGTDSKLTAWDDYRIRRMNFLTGHIHMDYLKEIFLDGYDDALEKVESFASAHFKYNESIDPATLGGYITGLRRGVK